jgi:hypothetical protein
MPFGFNNSSMTYMKIINSKTQSSIVGESCNSYFGTGGRKKGALLDEFSKWDNKDESAWKSCGDVTPCRFPISSANGKNNHFYRLRQQEMGDIKVHRVPYDLHPLKTKEWLDKEKKRRSPAEFAQEIMIDYSASVTNKAYENWNPSIHVINNGRFKYDPGLPIELQCDFNIDPMCWSVGQEFGRYGYTFKEYTERTTITENVALKVVKDFKDHKRKELYLYGDPSGRASNTKSLESDYDIIVKIFRQHGWYVIRSYAKSQGVKDRMNATNKRLQDWEHDGEAFEFISEDCPKLIESIEQTKRKDDGIDKDGMEHHSDGWSYKIAKKYPTKQRDVSISSRW